MLDQPSSETIPNTTPVLTASRLFRMAGVLLIVVFAIVYWLTLDTGLQPHELHGGDLITHHYAQVQARPGNAPGYPVYTMGGWLWFHGWRALFVALGQPFPNPTPILSSYSTLWALLALWLLYQILGDLLGKVRHRWMGILFCLLLTSFFGVTYFFWYYATTSEQYTSAIAQTLAIFYLYLRWDKAPERRDLLYWLAFLCGLSLAHMLTVAFIVPPLVAAVLWRDPSLLRSLRAIVTAVVAAMLPLISYIYVYVRGALNPAWWGRGHWNSPQEWFWSFVSTAQGRDELAWAFEPGRPFWGNGFPEGIWQELSLPLLLLGFIGISQLRRRHAFVIYGTLVIYAIFCWLYRFGNWFQVILPAYPLILLGIMPWYRFFQRDTLRMALPGRLLVLAALCAAIVWRVNASLPAADSRNRVEDTALDRAAILLDQALPQDARLFAAVDDTLALNYLTEIWGIRPDIKTTNSRDANTLLASGGSMLATVDATHTLLAELTVTPALDGFSPDWIQLSLAERQGTATAAASSPVHTVTDNLSLATFSVEPAPTGAPLSPPAMPGIDVLLIWQLRDGIWPENLAISLRPLSQGNQLIDPQNGQPIQQDRPRPLHGLWRDMPESDSDAHPVIIHDPYRLPLPDNQQPDALLLILYRQIEDGFENLAEITLPLTEANK